MKASLLNQVQIELSVPYMPESWLAPLAGGLVSPSQCLGTPAGGQEAGEGPLTSGGLFKITITSKM